MLIPVQPEPPDIAGRLEWAFDLLRPNPDCDAILGVVLAMRSLVASTHHADRAHAPRETVALISQALLDAGSRIAKDVAPLDEGYVLNGIRSVVRVLEIFNLPACHRFEDAEFDGVLDDYDHAILLADELDAVLRRRSIAAREARARHSSPSLGNTGSAGASIH